MMALLCGCQLKLSRQQRCRQQWQRQKQKQKHKQKHQQLLRQRQLKLCGPPTPDSSDVQFFSCSVSQFLSCSVAQLLGSSAPRCVVCLYFVFFFAVRLFVCLSVCLSVGTAAALLFQFFIIIFCRSRAGSCCLEGAGVLLMPQISVVINARLTRTRRQA